VETLFNVGTVGALTDGELLERFTADTSEAGELAFAALVARHGPMVLRVCQSVVRDPHHAQDAFQATFLVLVRKAGSIRSRDSVSSWLHGVAYRIAACARAAAARRLRYERSAAQRAETAVDDADPDELASVLHDELDRLPEKYRAPIVLCHLEGLTHEQAAERLRWPVGTVRSRMARGREQLRGRLTRRGVTLSAGLLEGALATDTARATFPAALARLTIRSAAQCISGRLASSGATEASVTYLAQGAINAIFLAKLKLAVLAAAMIATGTAVVAQQSGRARDADAAPLQGRGTESSTTNSDARDAEAAIDAAVARELRRLDLDLLDEEVRQLRDDVAAALRDALRAEQRNSGRGGAGPAKDVTGASDAQRAFQATRALYLAKARELLSKQRPFAGAKPPLTMRPLEISGSTALEPARIARIRARFVPARVIQILKVPDAFDQTGPPRFHELRSGDKVSKGDVLAVLTSAHLAAAQNDLLQALVQLELDQKILIEMEKDQLAVPRVYYLNEVRAVQGDHAEINRALNNLKLGDLPQDEIDALRAEAKQITADKDAWLRTPDGRWVRRDKPAGGAEVDLGKESEDRSGRLNLRAPIDGVVIERNVFKDEIVVDNAVTLFQIADTSRLLVTANLPEDALPALESLRSSERRWTVRASGMTAAEGFPGTITEIGYVVDPNQHTAVIKGYVDNPAGRLRAGQYISATVDVP
jgi:RNA polymerase sigma factor (sigma-70 family)